VSVDRLRATIDGLPLVDHHVHGATIAALDAGQLEAGLTESPWPAPRGTTHLDSQLGFAVRRWCAPVLELPAHVSAEAYVARRQELGANEATGRLLAACGVERFLVDTGYTAGHILGPGEMAAVSGAAASEIVRLESVAEQVAAGGVDAAGFADRFAGTLDDRARHAAGLKSVIAYRYGLDFDPEPPTPAAVREAVGQWLRVPEATPPRLTDPVLLRHVLWVGVSVAAARGLHCSFTSVTAILT
jgi:hypothetical protein